MLLLLLQIVNEMASAAGLPCDIDPALCAALRSQKTGEFFLLLLMSLYLRADWLVVAKLVEWLSWAERDVASTDHVFVVSHFLPRCMECRRGLAMRILSVCPSVRLSVRPSVTRVDCDKTVERSVQIYISYERTFSLVFWEEEWLGVATPSTWILGQPAHVGAKSLILNR